MPRTGGHPRRRRLAPPGRGHPLPQPPRRPRPGPALGGTRRRGLSAGEPHPAPADHPGDGPDLHGRTQLRTPSALAWPYLRGGLDAAITVTDADTAAAAGKPAALGVSSGPCGAAALAGARAALTEHRHALPVGPDSTVVLISTEGRAANPA
ncbi:hypothetical protein C1I98_02220 [Spongiactinospora gelatinilytica]|uniref:Tryptophan synthase beta chain-like PALP domain-containing protein n=1 Tax=Spongiactinospora gelatinilytica TaxID=2666298 RepID=A0A2W2H697_9ACTN|nr:pyridoxal-phosphate dependent enzyme [Spongiactinospora gelatinilytica]PZG56012.1 hypothetical protein C1I98_02220 [Spongiactinospora gelatinilytica]